MIPIICSVHTSNEQVVLGNLIQRGDQTIAQLKLVHNRAQHRIVVVVFKYMSQKSTE